MGSMEVIFNLRILKLTGTRGKVTSESMLRGTGVLLWGEKLGLHILS